MFTSQSATQPQLAHDDSLTTILAAELFSKLSPTAQEEIIDLLKSLLSDGRPRPVDPPSAG